MFKIFLVKLYKNYKISKINMGTFCPNVIFVKMPPHSLPPVICVIYKIVGGRETGSNIPAVPVTCQLSAGISVSSIPQYLLLPLEGKKYPSFISV